MGLFVRIQRARPAKELSAMWVLRMHECLQVKIQAVCKHSSQMSEGPVHPREWTLPSS